MKEFMLEAQDRFAAKLVKRDISLSKRERIRAREAWKRSLANGTIDSWYGCDLYDEMLDYAINFTFPWCMTFSLRYLDRLLIADLHYTALSKDAGGTFDNYNIPDGLNPEAPMDASVFLNGLSLAFVLIYILRFLPDPRTRTAIHAPTSMNWTESITYPFSSSKHLPWYPNAVLTDPPIDYSDYDTSMSFPLHRG